MPVRTFFIIVVATVLAVSLPGCEDQPGANSPSPNTSSFDLMPDFFLCGVVILVTIFIAGAYVSIREEKLKEEREAFEAVVQKQDRAIRSREAEVAKLTASNEKYRKELQKWADAETQRIEQAKHDLAIERQQALASVNAAKESLRSMAPTPGDVESYLRDRHVQGLALGECIDVTFLADRTGFIRLRWTIRVERLLPPTLTIYRGEKEIRTDVAFSGEHGDHITCGRRYRYKFVVRDDRQRALGQPLLIEVKTPTKAQWDAHFEKNELDHDQQIREKLKRRFSGLKGTEELKQQMKAEVKKMNLHPDDEEYLMSQVDAIAAELRNEEQS